MLLVGLRFFSLYITPLIAISAWIVSIIRLRSGVLAGLSAVLLLFIWASSVNPVLAVLTNPYLILLLLCLALANVWILGPANDRMQRYLIMADIVMVFMLGALHAWAIFLRQRELYFYEQSATWGSLWSALLTILGLCVPIIAIINFRRHTTKDIT